MQEMVESRKEKKKTFHDNRYLFKCAKMTKQFNILT